ASECRGVNCGRLPASPRSPSGDSLVQICVDRAEDPWRAVTRATEHYPVSAREIKHLASLLRRADISIRKHRYPHHGFDVADRLVLGIALIKVRARSSVHGQSLDATGRCDPCNRDSITVLTIPTGADLERYGDRDRAHDRLEDAHDQRLILQQRRAAQLSTDFL